MSRAVLIIRSAADRAKVCKWAMNVPEQTRIEFREAKRSTDQNDFMWELLTDVSKQKTNHGQKYTPDDWKALFMNALGQEVKFIPALEGYTGVIPLGMSTSKLSVPEMTALIDFILSWGAQNGVVFTIDKRREAA